MNTGVDPELIDMMNAVVSDYRQSNEPTAPARRDDDLWQRLDDLGLVRLTGSEESGGSGAGWLEAAELLSATARHAVRTPWAEHDLLACWLLDEAGLPCDGAVRTLCVLDPQGHAANVPWAAGADRVVILLPDGDGYRAADMDAHRLRITSGHNAIGEPRDTVVADLTGLTGTPVAERQVAVLVRKAALMRSIQVCAALDRILELSIEHSTSRVQFGRPLSRFQAVQHQIADMAAEATLARAATEAALTRAVESRWEADGLDFGIAVARSCAGHAASVVVRNAHQVHGAIGTTLEHQLHLYTRAALAWRSEYGSVRYWDDKVGEAALAAGAAGLWQLIAR